MFNQVVRLCTSALLAACCTAAFAQNQIAGGGGSSADPATSAGAAGAPKIEFDTMSKDLGEVEDGRKVQFQFEVKNAGTGTLNVPKVTASCGCTNARIEKQSLAPGETSIIKAEFDTTGRPGEQVKNITVESNDPNRPNAMLSVRSKVISEVNHAPQYIAFGEVLSDSGSSQTFTVEGRANPALEVTSVTVNGTNIVTAAVTGTEVLPKAPDDKSTSTHTRTKIAVAIQPGAPVGRFSGTVTVGTSSAKRPEIRVPFHGSVVGDMQAIPPTLFLRVLPGDDKTTAQVYLRSRSGLSFEVTGVTTVINPVTHSVQKDAGGTSVAIEIKVPVDLSRPTTDTITIKTTNPRNGETTVPVSIIKRYAMGSIPPTRPGGNRQTTAPMQFQRPDPAVPYDPTNGTVSNGIYRTKQ